MRVEWQQNTFCQALPVRFLLISTVLFLYNKVAFLKAIMELNYIFAGDYFGLLLKKRVTGFPFNIMNNPMYWGSTMNFLGYSLR